MTPKDPKSTEWIGYRPDIKVMDCTIRDGGLMNKHNFPDAVVSAVYQACVESGIDYMELGYKGSQKIFSRAEYGAWKFCTEEDIRRAVGDKHATPKLSILADVGKTNYHEDILPRDKSIIDMVRVAGYIHQVPAAMDMVKDAHDKGYETAINIMSVSTVTESELDSALEIAARSEAETIYLVDSFGAFYSEQIRHLTRKYLKYAQATGKAVGMHAHNNMQLAYANTIEALILGASMLDCSMDGLGRGAGNCPTELMLGFLHNPKFKLRPVLKCIQDHIEPIRKDILWGYDIPYMLTGLLNQHPRAAIKFNEGSDRADIVKFFDSINE